MRRMVSSATLVDRDGDEIRVERLKGRLYLTTSQGDCTATVGPFDLREIEALLKEASRR